MSPRELVILILGLAIVAVILRGLFVALQARRGQIRLAIDKNIPQDIDLDSLELAELPSGGARVVARSFAEVNRQNTAVAAALELDDHAEKSEPIPVLMDPVALHTRAAAPRAQSADTTDSVLFDYDTQGATKDNLAQVTPDYGDDDYDEDDEDDEDYEDTDDDSFDDESVDDDSFDEDDFDADSDDDEFEDDEIEEDYDDADEDEDDLDEDDFVDDDEDDAFSDDFDDDEDDLYETDFDDDLKYVADDSDEFSMTAGERIGYTGSASKPQRQGSLFGNQEDEPAPAKDRRKTLFAAFSRKSAKKEARKEARKEAEKAIPKAVVPPAASRATTAEAPHTKSKQPKPNPAPAAAPTPPRAVVKELASTKPAPVMKQSTREPEPAPAQQRAAAEPSEVVVINVMAKTGRAIAGDDLLHVLITSGMKFGDMSIFHRRLGGDNKGPVIFSIANILNPGTFDLNAMHEFTTLGVSLFLALPTAINNLEAFDQMLKVARQICDALDGEMRDDNRNLMTAQTIEHYRQRIRDFELRRLKAVGARG